MSDAGVDAAVQIGSVRLSSPVMTASGTAGHGAELSAFQDLSELGAVVVKSLSAAPWEGNPPPRVHQTSAGMINAVGLQNPGVEEWRTQELPELVAAGATVVASIWGRTVADYRDAAALVAGAEGVVAVEVNVSCPNLESRGDMFAHDPEATRAVIDAATASGLPLWAKLSPNVTDLTPIARAALDAGAEALTVANTLMGMVIDPTTRRPILGNGGGGLSGPAIRPVAVRAVYDLVADLGATPIVGVGGVAAAEHAVEFLAAGATAIQVGTATFADPRTPTLVNRDLRAWCSRHGVRSISSLTGAAHDTA